MIVLPKDQVIARELLERALADKLSVTILVFGDDQDQIANMAEVRAGANPRIRQVVWVRDPSLLTDEEFLAFRRQDEMTVVCALDLDDKPADYVLKSEANSYIRLEQAFLRAEMASGEGL